MASPGPELLLYGVGDIHTYLQEPSFLFDHVRPVLRAADVTFGQLEINISEQGSRLPQARHCARAKPGTARALREAGFQVLSFASNHCLDLGQEALFDTIGALEQEGLSVVGVGRNLAEARRASVVQAKGARVAFLAYNSILPMGYWAEENRAGCAPLRAWTVYEPIEPYQPWSPCRIHTRAHEGDLRGMVEDVRSAKGQADVVVVSMHWGIHFVPAVIAEYQREMAHAAIDAGADLILGHHAHILKGIEVYKGRAIFYSLGNFAAELQLPLEVLESPRFKEIQVLNPGWRPHDEYPFYACPPDSRKTIVAKCLIAGKQVGRVSFLPAYINPNAQPGLLTRADPRFDEVRAYVEEITAHQNLGATFRVEGDEVAVS
jgi:poly-gamma-glutamate synthesis protein (capsule biosynthesis protein)